MSGAELALLLLAGVGAALLLDRARWFRRRSLVSRLGPYGTSPAHRAVPSATSPTGEVLLPLLRSVTDRMNRLLGTTDDLATRLARADRSEDPTEFRLRQLVHSLCGLAVGAGIATLVRPGALVSILLVAGLPLLAALVDEQRLASRIGDRRAALRLELPVVAEQLGVLIDAGWSLPAAVQRIAVRGRGVAAADLRQVSLRIRQGLTEQAALSEWADSSDLDAVRRLVGVLALHREAGDLGRLIAGEARAIRAEAHRDLVERIERRSQLVWIPVTVATLVPGLLFLAVPFVSALSQVTGS
jgi:tight adherence protein C